MYTDFYINPLILNEILNQTNDIDLEHHHI